MLHLFPTVDKLCCATVADLTEPKPTRILTLNDLDASAFVWFSYKLRAVVKFMPAIFLKTHEVDKWCRVVTDLMLEAENLLHPSSLFHMLECTLTARSANGPRP